MKIVTAKAIPNTIFLAERDGFFSMSSTLRYTRNICLGRVKNVAIAKNQKLTPQVEKTAVAKCEGMAEKRITRTIYPTLARQRVSDRKAQYPESSFASQTGQSPVV